MWWELIKQQNIFWLLETLLALRVVWKLAIIFEWLQVSSNLDAQVQWLPGQGLNAGFWCPRFRIQRVWKKVVTDSLVWTIGNKAVSVILNPKSPACPARRQPEWKIQNNSSNRYETRSCLTNIQHTVKQYGKRSGGQKRMWDLQ